MVSERTGKISVSIPKFSIPVESVPVLKEKGDVTVRASLSNHERALMFVLLREPAAGVPLVNLPKRARWKVDRVAEVLARLVSDGWVRIVEARVQVALWAAVWLDHELSPSGKRWKAVRATLRVQELDFEPVDDRQVHERAFVLTGSDVVWRELHRRDCDCAACCEGNPPSATRPRPISCATCNGRPLPPLWECLRCGRGGRDRWLPPLPKPRKRIARSSDNTLKGGRA